MIAGHHVSQFLRLRMPGVLGRHLLELEDARDAMSQSKRRMNLACQAVLKMLPGLPSSMLADASVSSCYC